MPRLLIVIFCIIIPIAQAWSYDWQAQFDTLVKMEPGPGRDSVISQIVSAGPFWKELKAKIDSLTFPDTVKGQAIMSFNPCIDNQSRPWVLYIPQSYDPKKPSPMLIVLHGGVSRPDIIPDPKGWAEKSEFVALAEKRGWFVMFPLGQAGATWWDEVGMTNIMTLVRRVKSNFNMDDNRIFLGGFSDGGSAGFLFAMTLPTDFAAFMALNGHMGVGSEDGGLPTYATNLFNSPIFATTTDMDQLYPTSMMERTIAMAEKAGAKILYRRLKGEHNFDDIKSELPAIFDYLQQHPRNTSPDTIIWETATKGFGVCKWLAIDEITVDDPAPWYADYNIGMVDSSITFGIVLSDTFSGSGLLVASVVPGSFAQKRLNLRSGDIINSGNGQKITNLDDLNKFKSTLKHGDRVSIDFTRSINGLGAISRIPPPQNYLLFKRELPSAEIKATYKNNRFDLQGSRVGEFRILVNPNMIDLNRNIIVVFNGKKIYDGKISPDIDYAVHDFLDNRDRKLIFVNEISLRPSR